MFKIPKKVSKKILVPITAALFISSAVPAFAIFDENSSVGASFDWSVKGSTAGSYQGDAYTPVGYWNDIKFDSSQIQKINIDYHETFEIKNVNDQIGHTGWYASNIPNVSFDRDDDNKNGLSEEIEATETEPYENLRANTNYYFHTSWYDSNKRSGSGKFRFTQQRSAYGPDSDFNWEYQAVHYDVIHEKNYSYGASALLDNINNDFASNTADASELIENNNKTLLKNKSVDVSEVSEISEDNQVENELRVTKNINNLEDLNEYKKLQGELVKELKKENVEVLITLNGALSEQEVKQLANKYGIEISDFEIKAIDNNTSEWVTIGGVPTENGDLYHDEYFNNVTNGLDLSVEGYTMIEGTIKDFNLNDLEKIQSDDKVFLADIMGEYAKQVYGKDVDVINGDIAQKIDKLK
ncbi:hypothetical protein CD30_13355 [Ureibacillus massiliensis 4400831 = CIP 108448 = CCUG 49529]|uniref:Uncharacterized protein n=1 Tax=Ureibacillus massiliensis 4400831 = CIP 108448 = CCUG 49529 TaxID=1211035 RepID=A0A0A3J4N1_9BACL|nr:hypothetical protein [Ureibacillus massiliensis]KGR90133.1 hypothetical protein CD30_13355 [Ureibacillus massiliensis 4400831 = CIP 108448 = CCUG 49529]